MKVLGNRDLSLWKLIITQPIMWISHEFLQKTKTDIADIAHTGLQFPGLVYNLEASEKPPILMA